MCNKRYLYIALILLLSGFFLIGCSKSSSDTKIRLTISAAASLKEPLSELVEQYQQMHPEIILIMNMGASGSLMAQIKQGAPVDLFFSAANKQMEELEQENLIDKTASRQLLINDLVLIAPVHSSLTSFADLTGNDVKKIAIGEPDSVPAGSYGRATLLSMGTYQSLAPKFVLGKDVRQVLTYVSTSNVDAGLVYATDVRHVKDIVVVATAPADSHPPIIYPVAVIKTSKYPKEAKEFWNFLLSEQGRDVFKKYGFKLYQP